MKHFILTHQAAGKTYLVRRNPHIVDLSLKKYHPIPETINQQPDGTIMVGCLHEPVEKCAYYVMILPVDTLKRNLENRRKHASKSFYKWCTLDEIMPYRRQLKNHAIKHNIQVYSSFDEILEKIEKEAL